MNERPSRVARLELALVTLLVVVCAVGHLPLSAVAVELVANAGFQIGAAAIVLGSFWLLRPLTRKLGVLALAVAVIQLAPVLRLHLAPTAVVAEGRSLRIASVNLLFGKEDPRAFHAWLESERPDVIALLEVSSTWKQVLELERSILPHQRIVDVAPRLLDNKAFAIGIGSRYPLRNVRVRGGAHGEIPWLDVDLDLSGHPLRVLVVHAMGPRAADQLRERNRLFDEVAVAAMERDLESTPTCVLGDFNATLYSRNLTNFVTRSNLVDARRGHGREPTWFPLLNSGFGLLALDLDHLFVSADIQVTAHRVGPDIGSDHRPVIVNVRLP